MNTIQVEGRNFRYICKINPELIEGKINVYNPHIKYRNLRNKKLHEYGDKEFCKFSIPLDHKQQGLYLLIVNGSIKYIGICKNLSNRYNNGYGRISPANCYVGGRRTNCRINNFIYEECKAGNKVDLFFHEMRNPREFELNLIKKFGGPDLWNVSGNAH
ncbi:hypothetical protein [Brevundimonas sp.]|uniref:hypothetical protein n=1 Tax=Brevundimonas sp. TaxID=1871086 RepID=UPI0028A0BD10|nr:hypothetical protein [Brevundimonas sp.]